MSTITLKDADGKDYRSFEVLSDDRTGIFKRVLFKFFETMEQAERCLVPRELGFVETKEAVFLVYRSEVHGKLFHVKLQN